MHFGLLEEELEDKIQVVRNEVGPAEKRKQEVKMTKKWN
jgi:hypothetical protein